MVTIAIRDIERHISALLQRVQSGRETIEITDAGHVVARIVPAEPETIAPRGGGEIRRVWEARDKLAHEIGATWPEGLSAADAIDQDRRDL
ncbi:MAG: type II toxin-antitoxin system Phd/YefM family antitoxin [Thermomicrobiales bacterium]